MRLSFFSIRAAQEAQVMPPMASSTAAVASAVPGAVASGVVVVMSGVLLVCGDGCHPWASGGPGNRSIYTPRGYPRQGFSGLDLIPPRGMLTCVGRAHGSGRGQRSEP